MNLRRRFREHPDINLTPLIDVVFLLLIFFMVTTTFRHESDLRVELPEASREDPADRRDVVVIDVDAAGAYAVGERRLDAGARAALQEALAAELERKPGASVVLRADARSPHQSVVTAMDAAGRLGVRRLGIATIEAAH